MINSSKRLMLKKMGLVFSLPILTSVGLNTRSFADTSKRSPVLTEKWAIGGTDKIISSYPNDSIFDSNAPCTVAITEPRTLGPCFFSVNTTEDISAGQSGLPMMLCMRLIDTNCNPLANHEIEVWHTNNLGIYSADTSKSDEARGFRSGMCSSGDEDALKSTWFRGNQITDSNGRVNFKSCFPGWYSGRTIHIHIRIKNSHRVLLTTQFCFDETLTTEICTHHPKYKDRGLQDTPLAKDRFFRTNKQRATFATDRNSDGSLLAFNTIQIG